MTVRKQQEASSALDVKTATYVAGEMSDAAEVLNVIYDNLALVADGSELIERLFQWKVRQYVHCGSCGRLSHDMRHAQTFYYTSATALRAEACAADRTEPLGTLLARVEAQDEKSCDTDSGALLCQ